MRTFAIGDIHGAYLALVECLQKAQFDYANDRLIVLGDVCDGYAQVDRCIDELLKIKHCDYILGNHDVWALDWALKDLMPDFWIQQGGRGTMASYPKGQMTASHVEFLKRGCLWIYENGRAFVHGGFNTDIPLDAQDSKNFIWDRELVYAAWKKSLQDPSYIFGNYKDIFLGHTPVRNFKRDEMTPGHFCNVWDLDTGAGWGGPLTIMNIDTHEYWQSQPTSILYPGVKTRDV